MTTTELIKLLQSVEKGASGRSREITIYKRGRKKRLNWRFGIAVLMD